MTALCGGGTSSPNIITAGVVRVTEGAIALALDKYGSKWLLPVIPFLGLGDLTASSFCSTDPPALPTFTTAEADALLNLTLGSDFNSGLSKFKDAVLHYLWPELCVCDSGAAPTVPGPITPPSGTPVYTPPTAFPVPLTFQAFYPMLRAECKVLALGCGTPTAPAGWYLPGFNDSAWITPVAPAGLSAPAWNTVAGAQLGAAVAANASLVGNVELCSPAAPLAHNCEQFLVRWRVFLGDVTPKLGTARWVSAQQADGGWSSGNGFCNGTAAVVPNNNIGWNTFVNACLPNAWNVIAFAINPSNTSSANTWGTNGGIGFGLDFTSAQSSSGSTPCCPPDPSTQLSLDAILQMVTLIQRQIAPFGYVAGTAHSALSGAGSIGIQGLLGCRVTITTDPLSLGLSGTEPVQLFDRGWITFATADGDVQSFRLDHTNQLMFPCDAGVFTAIHYDLHAGVVVTITELSREP